MNRVFCQNCQVFLVTIDNICWKCNNEIEMSESIAPIIQDNEKANQNSRAVNLENFEDLTNHQGNQQRNFQNEENQETNFRRGGYRNLNPADSQAKIGIDNNTRSIFKEAFISPIFKPVIIIIIVLLGLGFLINYSNDYFSGASKANAETQNATRNNRRPQIPWFSSWFRSEPTGEEVFEKFEEVTLSRGKNLVSKTMFIKGKLEFLYPGSDIQTTYENIKFPSFGINFGNQANLPNPNHKPGIWDLDIDMEMSMKIPDKLLVSMAMTPKDKSITGVKLFARSGINGEEKWAINKSYIKGDQRKFENDLKSLPDIFSTGEDFIAMTFVKEIYQKLDFVGIETFAGRKHYFIKATKPNGESDSLYFDVETGLVNKFSGRHGEVYVLSYGDIDGIKMPIKLLVQEDDLLTVMTISNITKDIVFDDSIFTKSSYQ